MNRFAEWLARPYVALGFLALGMTIIPLNDALVKLLGETMPLGEIIAIRSLMSIMLIAVFSTGLKRMMQLDAAAFWQFTGARNVPCRCHGAVLCIAWQPAARQCRCHLFHIALDDHAVVGAAAG